LFNHRNQPAPIKGLQVHDLGSDELKSLREVPFPLHVIERKHCGESPVRVVGDGNKDIVPPRIVRVLSRCAGRGEDVKLPAPDRPKRMNGAGPVDQKGARGFRRMYGETVFQYVPGGRRQFFRDIPVDADQFVRIERQVFLMLAAIAASFSASRSATVMPVSAIAYASSNIGSHGRRFSSSGKCRRRERPLWFFCVFFIPNSEPENLIQNLLHALHE
jgi:hypothetical protein